MPNQNVTEVHVGGSEITATLGPGVRPGSVKITMHNRDQHLFDAHYEPDGRLSVAGPLAFLCDPARSSIDRSSGAVVIAAQPKTWFHPDITGRATYETDREP